jgi:6-phosphogluconolactonase
MSRIFSSIKVASVLMLVFDATIAISAQNTSKIKLFVGTYTETNLKSEERSQGIYIYDFDTVTGQLSYVNVAKGVRNPSYLALHPNKNWLYAVCETNSDDHVSAFRIDSGACKLTLLNSVPAQGKAACHLSIDHTGKYVMDATWVGGTVAMFPISNDGKLKEATFVDQHIGKVIDGKQQTPHAHMIIPSFDNRFEYGVDMGTDQIYLYELDAALGKMNLTDRSILSKQGAGPRQLVFHANKKWAYVVNELNGSVDAFNVNTETGGLINFQTISTIKPGTEGFPQSGDIRITPNGKFLYASNRASMNNIAMFSINQVSGELTLLGHIDAGGKTPRNFIIDPSGKFVLVANQNSSNVVLFRINQTTGMLENTGIITKIPSPVCLVLYL